MGGLSFQRVSDTLFADRRTISALHLGIFSRVVKILRHMCIRPQGTPAVEVREFQMMKESPSIMAQHIVASLLQGPTFQLQ